MNPKIIGGGMLALAVIAIVAFQMNNANTKAPSAVPSTTPTAVVAQPGMETMESDQKMGIYKDGTYEATGTYTSPAGPEEIDIRLMLEDGVITEASFTGKATNNVSIKLQNSFAEGFEEQVVGKPIDEIALTVVNGSSLTPKGFMDALEKIKSEAAQS